MNLAERIQAIFGIRNNFIKLVSEDEADCLVHIDWLNALQKELKIPSDFCYQDALDESLLKVYFTSNDFQHPCWKLVTIYHWKKMEGKVHRFAIPHEKSLSSSVHISYFELIQYVTKTNYRNLWEQAWRKYHSSEVQKRNKSNQKFNDALREILKRLYRSHKVQKNNDILIYSGPSINYILDSLPDSEDNLHRNLIQILLALETNESIFLICEKPVCTLLDCLMFSPALLENSTMRFLFVIYQLLQMYRSVQNSGLFLGPLTLSDIKVKENLWLQVVPATWIDLQTEVKKNQQSNAKLNEIHKKLNINYASTVNEGSELSSFSYPKGKSEFYKDDLTYLVQGWIDGSISNFDYLMTLNKLAGRKMDNPHCHPVIPWVMDFSVPEGGWRDLSKSKFRLNKGDKQLDLIYESATEASSSIASFKSANILQDSAITVPHHTAEVLSDITYYVYKARRMPKQFLCQHVRQKWVPAEYPSTIERLQEWTPDECIPEFFIDSSIFYSIHDDLNDLGFPWWCESPEDFIKKHRAALESAHVSERLHHWIDLTFGYKLSGPAALKSKNVCLHLVDQHTMIQNHGMVKLFSHPHPNKLSKSYFTRSLAPKTFRNTVIKIQDVKDSDEETSSESYGKSGFLKNLRTKSIATNSDTQRSESRAENQIIILPKDFNPLAALTHLESIYNFVSWTTGMKITRKNSNLHGSTICYFLTMQP